jgi:hypothetical protein
MQKTISLNYGAIRDTVYKFASKQLVTENKTTTLMDGFLKSVKENPALKIQNIIFKNFEDARFDKERLAERYINQNLKLMENISWESIINSNRDVRIELLENCHVEGSGEKGELYENIHTIIESMTRRGFNDTDRANKAYDYILEHLMRKDEVKVVETEELPNMLSWKFVTELAVNNFNQRFGHLNESERNIVKILLSPSDIKENYFSDLKTENINKIDSLISEGTDNESKKLLINFKNKVFSLTESKDENIIHLAELKETLLEFVK